MFGDVQLDSLTRWFAQRLYGGQIHPVKHVLLMFNWVFFTILLHQFLQDCRISVFFRLTFFNFVWRLIKDIRPTAPTANKAYVAGSDRQIFRNSGFQFLLPLLPHAPDISEIPPPPAPAITPPCAITVPSGGRCGCGMACPLPRCPSGLLGSFCGLLSHPAPIFFDRCQLMGDIRRQFGGNY